MALTSDFTVQLRSRLWAAERFRTFIAIALLIGIATLTVARDLFSSIYDWHWLLATLLFLLILAGAELGWLFLLEKARRRSGQPLTFLVVTGAVVEANFPTAGIILLTANPSVGPFRALATPMVTLYFLFIILASLRMRPGVCIASGAAASGGYLAVTLSTHALFAGQVPVASYGLSFSITTAVTLLVAGLLAALVSRQVLGSVSGAIASSLAQQKMEQDLSVARTIQQGLLPSAPPQAEGFDVAGQADPADQTGGDSYDWLSLPGGRTVVTLADVTGHGIGPALLAANLHAYVKAIFSGEGPLLDWMTRLNRHMAEDLREGRFVTFAAAVLHSLDGTVEVLSAGHGPILLYRSADGGVSELAAHGPPLGVLEEAEFQAPSRLQMRAGDLLAFITDGFFEQVNAAGEPFGIDRLKESVARHARGDAKGVVAGLYEDVRGFSAGTPQADDLTVTVIRRRT